MRVKARLVPSATKRKAQARKSKFTIKEGDYIDSREFSREECERFSELAVECGYNFTGDGSYGGFDSGYKLHSVTHLGVGQWPIKAQLWWERERYWLAMKGSNITPQFREFLDEEKSMSKFTKADLKDGMRLTDREGDVWWVCGNSMVFLPAGAVVELKQWRDKLTFNGNESCGIMKVTDRDGTVLFECEEENAAKFGLHKKKLYAVAHKDTRAYLTAGKKYEVLELLPSTECCGYRFLIADDDGDDILCNEIGSFHIFGGDWRLVYE